MAAAKSHQTKTLELLRKKQLEVGFRLEETVYKPIQNIGTGAYGVVCKAVDTRSGKLVAVKKIPRAFTAITLVKRTLREVKILTNFRHENIVAVLDMLQAAGTHGPDVYLVMDLLETDLHQIIHSKQVLTDQHSQYFLYQILRGLKYIHSAGVIHRDLKPSNLLVNADCLLKLGDFGMARSMEQGPENQGSYMTQYVATRWYRAPELVFSMLDYSCSADMWSVGCIFAEMIMRRQLFPGKDPISQVKMIVHYLGTPEPEVMEKISSDLIKRWIASCGYKTPLPFQAILPKASHRALDLAARLLQIAPWRRITSTDGLQHPYLSTYHNPRFEPVCPQQVVLETDAIESLSPDQLKAALASEADHFHVRQNRVSAAVLSPDLVPPKTDCEEVEMLSARMDELDTEQREPGPSKTTDAKAALRDALLKRAKNADAGKQQQGAVNAQTRHLERVERRKKRDEKQRAEEKNQRDQERKLSREDQSLLERWDKIHKSGQQQRLEGEIVDILYESFPSPIESSSAADSSKTQEGGAAKKQLDSAQLMDTWLAATDLDPEQLQDLEKEIIMTSP